MKRLLTPTLFALLFLAAPAPAQKQDNRMPGGKPARCEQAAAMARNWDVIESGEYVYWDYLLCPPDVKPANPLVKVWLTGRGEGYSLERWAAGRDAADLVTAYDGTKRAFTLYRDLDAVPLALFKAERRPGVAAETARSPFLFRGTSLIPVENLAGESAERVRKVFASADHLVRQAQLKKALLHDMAQIEAIFDALKRPLKEQQ
jgi:hypothetical protein